MKKILKVGIGLMLVFIVLNIPSMAEPTIEKPIKLIKDTGEMSFLCIVLYTIAIIRSYLNQFIRATFWMVMYEAYCQEIT